MLNENNGHWLRGGFFSIFSKAPLHESSPSVSRTSATAIINNRPIEPLGGEASVNRVLMKPTCFEMNCHRDRSPSSAAPVPALTDSRSKWQSPVEQERDRFEWAFEWNDERILYGYTASP